MATAEQIAQKAAEVEEAGDKLGGAKHFDQPGVRFSIARLRDEELARKAETGTSFRQHVEEGLLMLRAYATLQPPQFQEYLKLVKLVDYDKKTKWTMDDLKKALEDVQSGKSSGSGAAAAAKAREDALRKEVEELKAQLKAATAVKAK